MATEVLRRITSLFYATEVWVFDLDGTLVDSHRHIAQTLRSTLMSCGFEISMNQEVERVIGLSLDQMLTSLKVPYEIQQEVVRDFRQQMYQSSKETINVFSGVEQVLRLLRSLGKRIGIATNKRTDLAEQVVEASIVLNYVDTVVGSTGLPPKPAPDILLQALTNLGGTKALMIGDRPEDFLAAYNAGFPCIGIGAHAKTALDNGQGLIQIAFNSMDSLASIIETI